MDRAHDDNAATILVVDDDRDIVAAIELLLSGEGFVVHTAFDGAGALAEAQNAAFALIICDQWMPGLTGLAVVERLREQDIMTPVILMSAASRDVSTPDIHFLSKPFDVERLLQLVERLLS
jgi:DNA-binding NtrC family response regulator